MKTISYKNYTEFLNDVADDVNNGNDVCIVARDDNAEKIFTRIISQTDVKVNIIEMDRIDYSGEYYLSIMPNNELFIEPAWHGNVCYTSAANIFYVVGECDDVVLSHLEEGYALTVNIGENE